jgi:hypothetical protein
MTNRIYTVAASLLFALALLVGAGSAVAAEHGGDAADSGDEHAGEETHSDNKDDHGDEHGGEEADSDEHGGEEADSDEHAGDSAE